MSCYDIILLMKLRVLIVAILLTICPIYADTPTTVNPITVVQNVAFENCFKTFKGISHEKLFYLTLSAVTANRFTINEIQTDNGYIIFTAARQKYLATIANIDKNSSILKITPCNDIYYFQPGIVTNMFKYIDINLDMVIQ